MVIDMYQEQLIPYRDTYGMICQYDGDSGDTAQRQGLNVVLLSLANHNIEAEHQMNITIKELKADEGIYRRTANPDHWGYNPNNLSRDQRAMLELAMAATGNPELKVAAKYIFKRGGFHQNTHPGTDADAKAWKIPDYVSPGELAVYIRGLNMWYLYPVLTVLDLGLVADVFFRSRWDGANMSAVNILYANKKYRTVFSVLAKRLMPKEEYKKEIKHYYFLEKNGIPPLGDMYIEVINMLTGG